MFAATGSRGRRRAARPLPVRLEPRRGRRCCRRSARPPAIFATNIRLALVPFILIALRFQTARASRLIGDVLLGGLLGGNAALVGLALGRWQDRLIPLPPAPADRVPRDRHRRGRMAQRPAAAATTAARFARPRATRSRPACCWRSPRPSRCSRPHTADVTPPSLTHLRPVPRLAALAASPQDLDPRRPAGVASAAAAVTS